MTSKRNVDKMSYVQLLASLNEINRPPGGKDSIRKIVQNTFLTKDSIVLDVGCNTGYCTFELAHLVKCHVTGVDISPEMIRAANHFKEAERDKSKINFSVADGMDLPFKEGSFDLTMSGGSTAFIPDKVKAIREYARVTKTWGFIADVNFFYRADAPEDLIKKLNLLMEINIQPWTQDYWIEIYKKAGLESYYTYINDVYVPSFSEVEAYCESMSSLSHFDDQERVMVKDRLIEIMSLFAENHKYLSYGVFILRKRDTPEQISLFGE